MKGTVIVTGVSGFIGSAVASRLIASGFDVIGTVLRNPPRVSAPTEPLRIRAGNPPTDPEPTEPLRIRAGNPPTDPEPTEPLRFRAGNPPTDPEPTEPLRIRAGNPPTDPEPTEPLRVRVCDLSDRTAVETLFAEAGDSLTGVVHIAGLASDWGPEERFVRANQTATQVLLDEARGHGVSFFVNTSSVSVHGFGINHRGTTEAGPYSPPIVPYQRTKLAAESLVRASSEAGLNALTLRPGNVYGPGDTTTLYPLLDAVRAGTMGFIRGGRSLTCPVYIDDLVNAYLLAIAALSGPDAARIRGRSYNITTGEEITWKEFLSLAALHAELRLPRLSVPAWAGYAAAGVMTAAWRLGRIGTAPPLTFYRIQQTAHDYHFSIENARSDLGYTPRVGLDDGLRIACSAWRTARGIGARA